MDDFEAYEITESDCCGNGCTNCILDSVSTKVIEHDLKNRVNVLHSYETYKLLYIQEINPKIWRFHFKCHSKTANAKNILYIPPGHHVMMRAPNSSDTDTVKSFITRPYSPFWTDPENLEFKLLINLSPNGLMSQYIEKLKVDDLVHFRGPVGSFQHQPKNYDLLLLFCHGVAIAPIIAIIKEILNDEDDMTRIRLFACFENVRNILFREEMYEMNSYWNFQNRVFLSRPEEDFQSILKYKENAVDKRLDEDEIKIVIAKCKDLMETRSIICGSKKFQEGVKELLLNSGLRDEFIYIL